MSLDNGNIIDVAPGSMTLPSEVMQAQSNAR
jgi:hypothetical protein